MRLISLASCRCREGLISRSLGELPPARSAPIRTSPTLRSPTGAAPITARTSTRSRASRRRSIRPTCFSSRRRCEAGAVASTSVVYAGSPRSAAYVGQRRVLRRNLRAGVGHRPFGRRGFRRSIRGSGGGFGSISVSTRTSSDAARKPTMAWKPSALISLELLLTKELVARGLVRKARDCAARSRGHSRSRRR